MRSAYRSDSVASVTVIALTALCCLLGSSSGCTSEENSGIPITEIHVDISLRSNKSGESQKMACRITRYGVKSEKRISLSNTETNFKANESGFEKLRNHLQEALLKDATAGKENHVQRHVTIRADADLRYHFLKQAAVACSPKSLQLDSLVLIGEVGDAAERREVTIPVELPPKSSRSPDPHVPVADPALIFLGSDDDGELTECRLGGISIKVRSEKPADALREMTRRLDKHVGLLAKIAPRGPEEGLRIKFLADKRLKQRYVMAGMAACTVDVKQPKIPYKLRFQIPDVSYSPPTEEPPKIPLLIDQPAVNKDGDLACPITKPPRGVVLTPPEKPVEIESPFDASLAVKGTADALDRVTKELVRMLRKDKLLVIWLIDESQSMKPLQEEVQRRVDRVYKELGIITKALKVDSPVLSVVSGFGKTLHETTRRPTDDPDVIRKAFKNIPRDASGEENVFTAIGTILAKYKTLAAKQKRKIAVITVTDEAGSDRRLAEQTIALARKQKAPIYFLGREAVFGSPYRYVRWRDPKTRLIHWIRADGGPETAVPETLMWDGIVGRRDAFPSGFGPYEQIRAARETNGGFYVLPGPEAALAGGKQNEPSFPPELMHKYRPSWASRAAYMVGIKRSKFRSAVHSIVAELNPMKTALLSKHDPNLNLRRYYPADAVEFKKTATGEVQKVLAANLNLSAAIRLLESVRPLREKEENLRWRANYDLALAECYTFRVRLLQLLLAMDAHIQSDSKPKRRDSNAWYLSTSRQVLTPDAKAFDRLKKLLKLNSTRDEFLKELKDLQQIATDQLQLVIKEHEKTPWAMRAQHRLRSGMGIRLLEVKRPPVDPIGAKSTKLPKL